MLGLPVAEAALEAWADCHPEGASCAEERVRAHLPAVAARVPLAAGAAGTLAGAPLARLEEFFGLRGGAAGEEEDEDEEALRSGLFMQMLEPIEGQVHFLYFWRAFGEVACEVAGELAGVGSCAGELDLLRNKLIHLLEATAEEQSQQPRQIAVEELHAAVEEIRSISMVPAYWRQVAESVRALQDSVSLLGLEELAVVVISWLHEAASLPLPAPAPALGLPPRHVAGPSEAGGSSSSSSVPVSRRSSRSGSSQEALGLPVLLHIYDVSQEESVQKLNGILAHRRSPLKFGGVFHAGVEVHSLEWSYGCSTCETVPGISCGEPKSHPAHHYRQTAVLRNTTLSPEDIMEIISALIEEYPGDDYDLLRRNCCHFADDFCQRLGVGHIPGWVHRLARLGARLDGALQVAQCLQGKVFSVLQPGTRDVEIEDDGIGSPEEFKQPHHL